MRRLIDDSHKDLLRVLKELLSEDVTITVREVARRHAALKDASAFTRNSGRMKLITEAQQRQVAARNASAGPHIKITASLSEQLTERDKQIAVLNAQVKALVSSHMACVRAVMQQGGMRSLQSFWAEYKGIAERVRELNAMPENDVVPILRGRKHKPA
jgi:hypothetical protein